MSESKISKTIPITGVNDVSKLTIPANQRISIY